LAREDAERLQLRRAPLLAAACSFALGIALARNWQPASMLGIATVLLTLVAIVALRWTLRLALLPIVALWIAVGFWCWQLRPVPATQQALTPYADGLSREVRGRVIRVRDLPTQQKPVGRDNDPAWWIDPEHEATDVQSVDIAMEAVEEVTPDVSRMVPVTGGVRTTITAENVTLPTLHCGDVVEMPLRMKVPERYHDPGAWQYADYLLEQGISLHANVRAAKVRVIAGNNASLSCRLYAVQRWASGRMLSYVHSRANLGMPPAGRLTEDDAGMLNAMIFGDRTRLNHSLRLGFERTGSFHSSLSLECTLPC
jgi:competence protein ComEC